MPTYSEVFLNDYEHSINKLKQLSYSMLDDESVREIISALGTKVEIFFKTVILPSSHARASLENLFNSLPENSLNSNHLEALHKFRIAYNTAKHRPQQSLDLLPALKAAIAAQDALIHLQSADLGLSNQQKPRNLRRVYWISACDHYTCGTTEVHVHIPRASQHSMGVPSFDHFNISCASWDTVQSELAAVGHIFPSNAIIPNNQFEAFMNDRESLTPLVFEGSYKELITILSAHEARPDILPGLRREDNYWSMSIAIFLATCDVAAICRSSKDLASNIKSHVENQYAVPSEASGIESIIEDISFLIKQIPSGEWERISGPIWASREDFSSMETNAIAKHRKLPVVITDDYALAVKWDHL